MAKKIVYTVTFELTDKGQLIESYPNFVCNYDNFDEWADSNIDNMIGQISDIKGVKINVEKTYQTKTK